MLNLVVQVRTLICRLKKHGLNWPIAFQFHIDTGSADLWVLTNDTGKTVNITNTTDIAAAVVYADKSGLLGPVDFAELKLGGFTVNSQGAKHVITDGCILNARKAFINPNKTILPELLSLGGRNGIIGLGFDSLSVINTVLQRSFGNDTVLGRTPLSNIFEQDPDLPNNLDLFLQRSGDLETSNNGTFLIGEHAEGFEDIVNRPKLFTSVEARWTIPLDGISVNGKPLTLPKSTLPTLRSANSTQLGANMDTGSSNVFITAELMSAIYSAIPGAVQLDPTEPTSTWIVPCKNAANVTFDFG
jgi:saccharopepsin